MTDERKIIVEVPKHPKDPYHYQLRLRQRRNFFWNYAVTKADLEDLHRYLGDILPLLPD